MKFQKLNIPHKNRIYIYIYIEQTAEAMQMMLVLQGGAYSRGTCYCEQQDIYKAAVQLCSKRTCLTPPRNKSCPLPFSYLYLHTCSYLYLLCNVFVIVIVSICICTYVSHFIYTFLSSFSFLLLSVSYFSCPSSSSPTLLTHCSVYSMLQKDF